MATPTMEDYIEQIYSLITKKGYARVSDIADALGILPSSVTKMVQKLAEQNYLVYEKYRGIILTSHGTTIGKQLVNRHELLEQMFQIIGINKNNIYQEVEAIEHHLSSETLNKVFGLIEYFKADKSRIEELRKVQTNKNPKNDLIK